MKFRPQRLGLNLPLLFLVIGTPLLYGQNRDVIIVGVRALSLGQISKEAPERYLKTEDDYELLTISRRQPGKRIETATKGILDIYQKVESVSQEPSFQVAEQVPLPEGARSILLLTQVGKNGYRYHPIDDNFSGAAYDVIIFAEQDDRIRVKKITDKLLRKTDVDSTVR